MLLAALALAAPAIAGDGADDPMPPGDYLRVYCAPRLALAAKLAAAPYAAVPFASGETANGHELVIYAGAGGERWAAVLLMGRKAGAHPLEQACMVATGTDWHPLDAK